MSKTRRASRNVTPKPLAFSTMVKAIGSRCNMDCQYCYYLGKQSLYPDGQERMSDELLEEYTKQYIEANDVPLVTFTWHGGEPLLAGIDYYQRALEQQEKHRGDKTIENTMQTNGLLVTDAWCEFWAKNNFLIGISIDGPADIHDAYRQDKGGRPSFKRVMAAIELMKKHGVEFNTLSTINAKSAGRGKEVYAFMKQLGSRYMQFLPVVEHVMPMGNGLRSPIVPPLTVGSELADWSISAKVFGQFMIDIFDVWVREDVGDYYVQLFDATLANWVGAMPGLCAFTESCGDALVVEHNGDVYSCDHFVYPEHKLGNIMDKTLRQFMKSDKQIRFGKNKRKTLPTSCQTCFYYPICRGECPKHRFATNDRGETGLNALCQGYHDFFKHVHHYMDFMAAMLRKEQPPALVKLWAAQQDNN